MATILTKNNSMAINIALIYMPGLDISKKTALFTILTKNNSMAINVALIYMPRHF